MKNDDYEYLINCNDLIRTCKEALLENDNAEFYGDDEEPNTNYNCHQLTKPTVVSNVSTGNKSSTTHLTIGDFCQWLDIIEQELDTVCYCASSVGLNGSGNSDLDVDSIVARHQKLQQEVETCGRQFKQAIITNGSLAAQSLLAGEERRWQILWLRSLEFLLIVEANDTVVCPRHFTASSSQRSARDVSVCNSEPTVSKRIRLSDDKIAQLEINAMRNRRTQTHNMCGSDSPIMTTSLPSGKGCHIVYNDVGYSSDADLSDFVDNRPHKQPTKMSRSLTQSNSSDQLNSAGSSSGTSSARSFRKRLIRRRRAATATRSNLSRPWSVHEGWTEWDYYQPPSYTPLYTNKSFDQLGCTQSEVVDEHTLRTLTEFGENYENWFKNEDNAIIRSSTPIRNECDNDSWYAKNDSPLETKAKDGDDRDDNGNNKNDQVMTTTAPPTLTTASTSTSTPLTPSTRDTAASTVDECFITSNVDASVQSEPEEKVTKKGFRSAYRYVLYMTILTALISYIFGHGLSLQLVKQYPHRPPPC